MSKVLVDRELLELLRNFTFLHDDGCAGALRGNIDKALAARPAEAEGAVPVVCYLRAFQDGTPHWTEDCVCEDAVYPNHDGDETYSMPMVRQADHLAALSAVTAERDRLESTLIQTTTRHFAQQWKDRADDKKLDECLSEGIAMLEAERDRLRDAAGKAIAWLDAEQNGSGVGINRRLKLCRDAENALRAAMAAKEAEPEHVCSGCGAKGWTGNCLECIPY